MGMRRRKESRDQELWIATDKLAQAPGHVFYRKLNQLLAEHGFDRFAVDLCLPFYEPTGSGRPSIPPGVYFRMLFVGYFEGLDSQRGISWRCADSRSLSEFLGYGPTEETPDHSTLTRIRQRLPQAIHDQVFGWVLGLAAEKKLLSGKTVAVDSTTLEANAAMKSIVRKDTSEDYEQYLTKLANEEGIEDPSDEDLRRFDRTRKGKTTSNDDWESPSDPDAQITKMKDGRTHLAYKAEHVVEIDSEFILHAAIHPATASDAETLLDSMMAEANLQSADSSMSVEEVVADKGYHKAATLESCDHFGIRTYIPEPHRPHGSTWTDKSEDFKRVVTNNRARIKRAKSKNYQRLRSERVERSFAHVCETGGARRSWLRGLVNVSKRYLMTVAAHNFGLVMRKLLGVGKPKALRAMFALAGLLWLTMSLFKRLMRALELHPRRRSMKKDIHLQFTFAGYKGGSATACKHHFTNDSVPSHSPFTRRSPLSTTPRLPLSQAVAQRTERESALPMFLNFGRLK
jgi:transposase